MVADLLMPPPHSALIVTAHSPVRKWTIPRGDCVANPTADFYQGRRLVMTNEGNALVHKWVALDRYNDPHWHQDIYEPEETAAVWRTAALIKELQTARDFDRVRDAAERPPWMPFAKTVREPGRCRALWAKFMDAILHGAR